MKKLLFLAVAPFAFVTASMAQITQETADSIVLQYMNQETRHYMLYALNDLQDSITIYTSNEEELELSYPCWVFYVKILEANNDTGYYLIVNESNGNLVSVNTTNDVGPTNLAEWRFVKESFEYTIAFISITPDGNYGNIFDLCIMDKPGIVRKIVDSVSCSTPIRSHCGTKLLFGKRGSIFVINTDGTGLTSVETSDSTDRYSFNLCDWSPDDTQLIGFQTDRNSDTREQNLILYNIVNKTQTVLQAEGKGILQAKFSPDGNQIFYIAQAEDTATIIHVFYYPVYKIDIDGNNNQVFIRRVASLPVWSPQGDKMAYLEVADGNISTHIFIANPDGSNPQQLTFSVSAYGVNNFQWTPDGKKIVYLEDRKICIINTDGSGQTQLTDADNNGYDIEITPDGEYILYSSPGGIVMMKLDGSERKILYKDGCFPVVCK